jgi:hypothetical protein
MPAAYKLVIGTASQIFSLYLKKAKTLIHAALAAIVFAHEKSGPGRPRPLSKAKHSKKPPQPSQARAGNTA